MSYGSGNQFQNDTRKAANHSKKTANDIKNTAKKAKQLGSKLFGKPIKPKVKSKLFAALPLPIKIGLAIFFGIILISSFLPAGTGGIYSNENTHIYSNSKDPNFPSLEQMNIKDIVQDNVSKDEAVNKMSEYAEMVHEIIENEKDADIKPVIDAKIASEGWDHDETYAQINDQSDFSAGTSITGESIGGADGLGSSTSSNGEELVAYARKFIGPNYVLGGDKLKNPNKKGDTNSIDCSGFTQQIFKRKAKINLPREAKQQRHGGKIIGHGLSGVEKALPGDLLIYYDDGHSNHVGIYSGKRNGKHHQIHSSVGWGKRGVMETPLHRTPKDVVRVLKPSKGSSSIAVKAVKIAISHEGKVHYVQKKSKLPKGKKFGWKYLDCGRMIQFAYREAGKKIPQNTAKLKSYGKKVGKKLSKARVGDIIVYNGGAGPYRHVALYAGDNRMVEVATKNGGILRVVKARKKKLESIRRVVDDAPNSALDLSMNSGISFPNSKKKTVRVPRSVNGKIVPNITNYSYWSNHLGYTAGKIAQMWKDKGRKHDGPPATINGAYLAAFAPVFGKDGDVVRVHLANGKSFFCIICDGKGADKGDTYGHVFGDCIDIVEWYCVTNNPSSGAVTKDGVNYQEKLRTWLKKKGFYRQRVIKVDNYGKFAGGDFGDGYSDDTSSDITVEDLKVLSAYSVSINNLHMYEMEGKVKRVAFSVGYRMSGNKTYRLVDNDGNDIDVKTDKYGRIDFKGDMESKIKEYANKMHKKGKTAFYDVTFQTDSSGSTTYTKHIKIDTGKVDKNNEPVYLEYDMKYGVPIVKNKDISKICMPMFDVKPKAKYVNGKSITNAEAIIELTKNTIALYLDGDPNNIDGLKETISENLQNKYAWPAPGHEKKKDYKYSKKKKALTIKGAKGDSVVSIADGTVKSITGEKKTLKTLKTSDLTNVISTDFPGINKEEQGNYKDLTPKTIIISHEKGAVQSIYKNVIIVGGLKQGQKVKKGDKIGTFAGKKIIIQIKHNGKYVNPLEFLKEGSFDGKFIWPLAKGYTHISSPWGYRNCPYHGKELHSGIDIPAPTGTPIKASASGTVKAASYVNSYGKRVIIEHSKGKKGIATWYCHMSKINVKNGQKVNKGQVIGKVGSTGDSTGAHLHFGYYINGESKNPLKYVKKP